MVELEADLARHHSGPIRGVVPGTARIQRTTALGGTARWCYDVKYKRDGTIERFKARFVACGYSQIFGKDFTHTFSATLRATSFRLFLAIAAGRKPSVVYVFLRPPGRRRR